MLTVLLRPCLCLALGEGLAIQADIPIAGAVLGLCLFALMLLREGGACAQTQAVVGTVMPHYGMLYVPAGVGILNHASSLPIRAIPILVGVVVGTVVTVAITGLVSEGLTRALGLAGDCETTAESLLTMVRA